MSPLTEPTRLTLAKGQPVPNDPYFAFNSLLLHGNGTNGSTVITDSSGSPKTVTAFGNAQISTAQSKFGGSSIAFDGTGDYLTTPASDAFNFSTSDFTIELWFRANAAKTAFLLDGRDSITASVYTLYTTVSGPSNRLNLLMSSGGGSFEVNLSPVTVVPIDTWSHVAITRSGNLFTFWIDGVSSATTTTSVSIQAPPTSLKIGALPTNTNPFNGYIDDLRITKGVARYTSNFTPPTAPFPDF